MRSKHPLIAGIDIGVSNVKVCFGFHSSNLTSLCLPGGAGPYDGLIKRFVGEVTCLVANGSRCPMGRSGRRWYRIASFSIPTAGLPVRCFSLVPFSPTHPSKLCLLTDETPSA